MSNFAHRIEGQCIEVLCPLLADLCKAMDTFHRDSTESFDRLGKLEPEFRSKENWSVYTKDLYNECIYYDPNLEEEKKRLKRENDPSFIEFYKMKQSRNLLGKKGLGALSPRERRKMMSSGKKLDFSRPVYR